MAAKSSDMKKLITLALLVVATLGHAATNQVTVAWDPNPEPDIAEYAVYYGKTGTGETNKVSAGLEVQQEIQPLWSGTNYWFYVTAKNAVGLESDPSEVLFYDTPATKPNAPTGVVLTFQLLTSSGVMGPFTNTVEFKLVEEMQFYLAEVDGLRFETNEITDANLTTPPLPEP